MKSIELGDIGMYKWKKGDELYPEWMHEDEDYVDDIKNNLPDEVILPPNTEFTLKIDYPLSTPFIYKFKTGENGMTREDFVKLCVDSYQFIYDMEEDTSTVMPELIPGMYNRVSTDGDYGIWGHELSDLILCTAQISDDNVIELGVDS